MRKKMLSTKKLEPLLRERGLVLEKSPEGGISLTPLYIGRKIHEYDADTIDQKIFESLLFAHNLKLKMKNGEPIIEEE